MNLFNTSSCGKILQLEGAITFSHWPHIFGFGGQFIDLKAVEMLNTAALGMFLKCAKDGIALQNCNDSIVDHLERAGVCQHCRLVRECGRSSTL